MDLIMIIAKVYKYQTNYKVASELHSCLKNFNSNSESIIFLNEELKLISLTLMLSYLHVKVNYDSQ